MTRIVSCISAVYLLTILGLSVLVTCADDKSPITSHDARIFMQEMERYLASKSDSMSIGKDFLADAQDWLVDYSKKGSATVPMIKAYQAFLQLDRLKNGELCGLEGSTTVKILKKLFMDIVRYYSVSNEAHLSGVLFRALSAHSKSCITHNLILLVQAEKKLDKLDLDRVYSITETPVRLLKPADDPQEQLKLTQLFKLDLMPDLYNTVANQLTDKDVAQIQPDMKGSMIPKAVLETLYERHVYKPCLAYVEALDEIIEIISEDMTITGYWADFPNVKTAIYRHTVCDFITRSSPIDAFKNFVGITKKTTGKTIRVGIFDGPHPFSQIPKFVKS